MNFIVEYSNSPEERAGTHLVLMLHGYGSHELDLMQIAQMLGVEATFAGLRAPQPVGTPLSEIAESAFVEGESFGYQWFPLTPSLESDQRSVELATDYIIDFLEEEAQGFESITLLGFSQGMAMATSVARRRPDMVHAIVGCSGFVVPDGENYFLDDEFKQKQIPVFYGRGDADTVISPERVNFTTEWLKANAPTTFRVYPNLPHSISPIEVKEIAKFLEEIFQK